jgi:hypothetical protein
MDTQSTRTQLIYKELGKVQSSKRISSSRIWVQCPFGTHNDSSPSLSINLDTTSKFPVGTFYCFGCRESGSWNKLAKKLGVQGFGKQDQQASYIPPNIKKRKQEMLEVKENTLEQILAGWDCLMPIPFSAEDSWRGINGKLLNEIGAQYTYDNSYKKIRVILPCYVDGELEGAIKASQEKEKISYLNSPGSWVKSKGLFPFDYIKASSYKSVVLVEGPRDALRLIQKGIPALCIFGTNNWNDNKRDLVLSLDKKVFSMMDGDLKKKGQTSTPGAMANELVKTSFRNVKVECRVLNLGKVAAKLGQKVDPANAPESVIRKVKFLVC